MTWPSCRAAERKEAALSQQFREEYSDATTTLREESEAQRMRDTAQHEAALAQLEREHAQVVATLTGERTSDSASFLTPVHSKPPRLAPAILGRR
eukprot:COSAG05_NODE_504_length_9208_cov_22.420024_6_plen_95_part_00